MRLILVRHGETLSNSLEIIQGQTEGELSELGIIQAKSLGNRLKDFKIDAIYSSPLKRARDTAKEITVHHKSTPFFIVENLKEFGFGKFEGTKKSEINFEKDFIHFENWHKFLSRLNLVLNHIKSQHKGQSVLIVAHGGVIAVITKLILKMDLTNRAEKIESQNTSVFIFDMLDDGSFLPQVMNCTKHLEGIGD